jgi:hypothetical protein
MSRRLRKPETVELMTAVEQQLVALLALGRYLVHIVDGKALAVSAVSKDRDTGYTVAVPAPIRRATSCTPSGAADRFL